MLPIILLSFVLHVSAMTFHVDTDAAYLVTPGTKSRITGFYYLSSDPSKNSIPSNAPFHVVRKFPEHVVVLADKDETAWVFFNSQEIIFIPRLLIALGHLQPLAPLTIEKSTFSNFVNTNMRTKRSTLWDMRFHWLRNAELKHKVIVQWGKGANNKADYFTKHFTLCHHKKIRPALFVS